MHGHGEWKVNALGIAVTVKQYPPAVSRFLASVNESRKRETAGG